MSASGSNKKVANKLVAMSSAAVVAVYGAGYVRTKSAAERMARHSEERRVARVHPVEAAPLVRAQAAPVVAQPEAVVEVAKKPADVAKAPAVREAAPALPSDTLVAKTQTPEPAPVTVSVAPTVTAPPPPPPAPAPEPPKPSYRDGTYTAWGSCRHGDIEVTVTIEAGLIKSALISDCRTRYSCSVIDKLPPLVPKTQKAGTDWVSGATESSDAYDYAVGDALAKAKN